MTKAEFDNLRSDGRVECPGCGLKSTTPYPSCGCPLSDTGYGTRHINRWHHDCQDAQERTFKELKRLLAKRVREYCVTAINAAPTFQEPRV